MRKFIIILCLFLISCGARHKTKSVEKEALKTEEKYLKETQSTSAEKEKEAHKILDSGKNISEHNSFMDQYSFLQNFTLKNTGKCLNPSVHFVTVTDSKGNTTQIPIDNNTELSFNNENKSNKEFSSLKQENTELKQSILIKDKEIYNLQKNIEEHQASLQKKVSKKDVETVYKPYVWMFVLVGIILLYAGYKLYKTIKLI